MGVKSLETAQRRRQRIVKFSAVLLIALVGALFVKHKKDMLVHESAQFLETLLSRESRMSVQIGKISGKLSGVVRFDDVRLEDPDLPVGLRLLFRAKGIEVRYRLLDFFTKKFNSKVHVTVREPEVYWHPAVTLRRDRFGVMGWAREWVLAKRGHLGLTVEDLKLVVGADRQTFDGIQAYFEDDAFELTVPLRHLDFMGQDITTHLRVHGKFEAGLLNAPDAVTGELMTEASVVNWSPLPWEAVFRFEMTGESLTVRSSNFLGGFEVNGKVDFQRDDEIELDLKSRQYPLSNLEPFVGKEARSSLEGRLDLEARWHGRLESLNFEAYARIAGGRTGRTRFQAMDVHLTGVYPTLRLSDSRILLEDGSVMRFAEKDVEFGDVFNRGLYKKLISGEEQDTVVLGDWEFKRPSDSKERPEFMMQRSFGDNASMHIKKYNEADEEKLDSPENHDMEVGFEYHLRGQDSLKFEMREDERFVGVERKLSF